MNKAEKTRLYILEKAFDFIYQNGYQATSVDKIIETTNVTKGAFYYHFKNKEEMGLAIIKELIQPRFNSSLVDPLSVFPDPINGIYQTIENFMLKVSEQQLKNGCPTNNLIQEMAPINEKFKQALKDILETWRKELSRLLSVAAAEGKIENQNFDQVADFIVTSYEGARGIGKLHNSYEFYHIYLGQLKRYLNTI